MSGAAALNTGQVAAALHLRKTGLLQEIAHGLRLVVAVLEHQPAAASQPARGLRADGAQVVEALHASRQSRLWFVRQCSQMCIAQ